MFMGSNSVAIFFSISFHKSVERLTPDILPEHLFVGELLGSFYIVA